MALYAIGDLHLSLGSDKPMDVFGRGWENYTEKIRRGFERLNPGDVCLLCGDTSWAMSLDESLYDFKYINEQHGKKIILKGNHDYWWNTAAKMKAFFAANMIDSIEILHNNCFFYGDTAICGTRGWFTEGKNDTEFNRKIVAREAARLRVSLQAAGNAGEKLCFFHYPPRFKDFVCNDIIDVMNEYDVKNCWYGHIHDIGHRYAVQGEVEGITYRMVSADYVDFIPQLVR